jgi:hypothetical protein
MYYCVIPHKAGECLHQLHALKQVHPYFTGYLALVRKSHQLKRLDRLDSPIAPFFKEYLKVAGGPGTTYPYVRLFVGNAKSSEPTWQNGNIGGTYGSSGRRETLTRVFGMTKGKLDADDQLIAGHKDIYSLPDGHAQLVLTEWCNGKPLPIYPLALFLYRDLALELDEPTTTAWVERFQEEFGYRDADGNLTTDYHTLFTEEEITSYQPAEEWLVAYDLPS